MAGTIEQSQTRSPAVRTPGRLLALTAAPVLCVLAFSATVTATVSSVRDGYRAVDERSQADVAAAGRLSYDVADMDGKAAEILLVGDGSGLPQSHDVLYTAFEKDRADANAQLAAIGSGLDGVPGGTAAFVAVENGLDRYASDVTEAFYLDGLDHGQAPARPPAAALAAYQSATAVMHQTGTCVLAETNALRLDEGSAAGSGADGKLDVIGRIRLADIAFTALVLVVLIVVQVRLARKFHRFVNPLIALSTALTLAFGVLLFSALEVARDSYVTLRSDATATLWESEAYGADMNASDSRLLLDLGASTPSLRGAASAEQTVFDVDRAHVGDAPPAFAPYLEDDQHLRSLAGTGSNNAELSSSTAFDIGRTDQDFAKFVSLVNNSGSDDSDLAAAAASRGANALLSWLWLPSGWAVLMLLSILGGVAPRWREYLPD